RYELGRLWSTHVACDRRAESAARLAIQLRREVRSLRRHRDEWYEYTADGAAAECARAAELSAEIQRYERVRGSHGLLSGGTRCAGLCDVRALIHAGRDQPQWVAARCTESADHGCGDG